MIEIIKILEEAKFPVIDFKFQNQGQGTALLRLFCVHVDSMEINSSPVLRPFLEIENDHTQSSFKSSHGALGISIRNDGWGAAKEVCVQLKSPIRDLFPTSFASALVDIDSGETTKKVIYLSQGDLSTAALAGAVDSHKTGRKDTTESNLWATQQSPNSLPLGPVELDISYSDLLSAKHSVSVCASTEWLPGNYGGSLSVSDDGFTWNGQFVQFSISIPSAVYYVSLDPAGQISQRQYSISHKIPSGDVEHFNVMLGSDKSCRAKVWFEFMIDSDKVVQSEKFTVNIWNPMNERYHLEYRNGDELISKSSSRQVSKASRDSSSLIDQWELDEFKRSPFPFIRSAG